jgi:Asp-tRNA(Asn)/Glu-tRNA(Gln) amidotransferase A subunit family amidase
MVADDLVWRSGLDLAALIRTRQVSPVEVTERILERIEVLNPRLNAFCYVKPRSP